MSACAAKKQLPPPGWTRLDEDVNSVFSPTTRELKPGALPSAWKPTMSNTLDADLGSKHGIGNPIHIYPLYENAYRAHNGQSIQENNDESAQMYAEFAEVASRNQYAWSYGPETDTKESIGTVSKSNRMICFPCEPLSSLPRSPVNFIDARRSFAHERLQQHQPRWRMHPDVHRLCTGTRRS